MAEIRGSWDVQITGVPHLRHFWQRDHQPTDDDVVHVHVGLSDVHLMLDREALDSLAAHLATVRAEWAQREARDLAAEVTQ